MLVSPFAYLKKKICRELTLSHLYIHVALLLAYKKIFLRQKMCQL